MTYAEFMRFLGSRLNYERRGMPAADELRVERTAALLESLGNPQHSFRSVHVAGTKGKGSTSHYLASLLRELGFRVGLHTSPHLLRLEERFMIDHVVPEPIVLEEVTARLMMGIEATDRRLHDGPLTFFEITTALAFLFFAERRVDWAVVEVGMGGRLDATNVLLPEVSVITSISKDHTRQLGDTLDAIAREKAGIIKRGKPIISGVTDPLPAAVIEQVAASLDAPLSRLECDFHYHYLSDGLNGGRFSAQLATRTIGPVHLSQPGEHQARNAAITFACCEALGLLPKLHDVAVEKVAATRIPGRIEVLHVTPDVILDTAHNDASTHALAGTLSSQSSLPAKSRRVLILAVSLEKDWKVMLDHLLPLFGNVVVTRYLSNPRAVDPEILYHACLGRVEVLESQPTPQSAWETAVRLLGKRSFSETTPGLICMTGSFYLAGEMRPMVMEWLSNHVDA